MRNIGFLGLVLLPVLLSGCNLCCCGKRASELSCPTDIRKTQCWCFGEDAVFSCPCGPDEEFYGYQPTCWRNWPASGAQWRDSRCPPPPNQQVPLTPQAPSSLRHDSADSRESTDSDYSTLPNPFRGEHPEAASEHSVDFVGGF